MTHFDAHDPSAVTPTATQPPDPASLTPAMRQYWEHRQQAPDAILLFRMGDFYELFYDHAELAAGILGITLTSRDNGRTPLAGIPYHALESYLSKLVAAGHKVAISEQVEDAKQAKGVVKREIVRIITAGTLTDDALLERSGTNYLAAVVQPDPHQPRVGLALLELASGTFLVADSTSDAVVDELARFAPAEILLPESSGARGAPAGRHPLDPTLRQRLECSVTYRSVSDFAPHWAEQVLCAQFEVASLEGFGFDRVDAPLSAAGALLCYIRETQKGAAHHLHPPRRIASDAFMTLDQVTLRSLEITQTLRDGARRGSLLASIDRTRNPMGARLLKQWLTFPLRDLEQIRERQRLIKHFVEHRALRDDLSETLRQLGDIERIIARLGVERATPRDVRALGDSLAQLPRLRAMLAEVHQPDFAPLSEALTGADDLAAELTDALAMDPPNGLRDGGIFAPGHNSELDRLRTIGEDGQAWLAELQARESKALDIPNLKVGFNKVFGYFLEVSHAHRERVPEQWVRKQTVKAAERYITEELKAFESESLTAQTRALTLEYELFAALRARLAAETRRLSVVATTLAQLDVLCGLASFAVEARCTRPEFVDQPVLEIEQGCHPVVMQATERFTPNDTHLDADGARLALLTGPNMAGKSTYIRQVALLTLLAHSGAWVPAQRMCLGVVDRIFTRVGAADDLARGQSTFMVEMLETASILHHATRHSLVILDEVGRGTSTFDGLALAWAIAEQLATRTGCRGLFATHYHEMTELPDLLPEIFNLNVAVREFEDTLVFLHRIDAGPANRSFGLHVAKLAGVPAHVLERAHAVLSELERTFSRESQRPALAAVQRRRTRQLRLFEEPEEQVVRQLRALPEADLDGESAMELIKRWRRLLAGEGLASNVDGDAP